MRGGAPSDSPRDRDTPRPPKGYIYISGYFLATDRRNCGGGKARIDNDPNFWDPPPTPPTWGICRPDLTRLVCPGDYAFFVLPARSKLPQMIYGYMRVSGVINHMEAFHTAALGAKRMRKGKNPNGNILVRADGSYHREADGGLHQDRFARIKESYVVGDLQKSEFLLDNEAKLHRLALSFVPALRKILGRSGSTPIEIISRKGRRLTESQIHQLLIWLGASARAEGPK